MDARLRAELVEVVGPNHVLVDPSVTASYEVDWTGRFRGRAAAVIRPGGTAEVAAVLERCHAAGAAVVPQGGNTGLVGGGVPRGGEVVVSLRRLDTVEALEPHARQVTAGAGATLAAVDGAVAPDGLAFGVDLAARDSATIGGMIATNAGGLRMLRYGDMRAQLVGVEAVTAAGRVVAHLGGLTKDNTGYHLPSLLAGSEGTLAVVTRARLRLVARASERAVALCAYRDVAAALDGLLVLRRQMPQAIEAAELCFATGIELVCSHLGLAAPFPAGHPVYLLVEAACSDPAVGEALAQAVADARPADSAFGLGPAERARLWRYREAHTEALNAAGTPVKLDVTLPMGALAGFASAVPALVEGVAPGARCVIFGHAADGNLHVNVLGAPVPTAVEDAVFRAVSAAGGSISAEHGIGVAKRAWLHLNRSDTEIAVFRAIKSALDERGILNPGVLLPDA